MLLSIPELNQRKAKLLFCVKKRTCIIILSKILILIMKITSNKTPDLNSPGHLHLERLFYQNAGMYWSPASLRSGGLATKHSKIKN